MGRYSILHLEDDPQDAALIKSHLHQSGVDGDIAWVDSKELFFETVKEGSFDVILLDYNVPGFSGLEAIHYVKKTGQEVPMIIVSGAVGDEAAAQAIQSGAVDYVLKDNLTRLPVSIQRAVNEHQLIARQKEQARLHERLINTTNAGMFKCDTHGNFVYFNKQLLNFLGYEERLLILKGWELCLHPDDKTRILNDWGQAIALGEPFNFECRFLSADTKTIWAKCSCIPEKLGERSDGFLGTFVDITEHKEAESELHAIARYDALTDLPNRRLLYETLSATLNDIKHGREGLTAVLFIDLDYFKKINDTLGHRVGDLLLQEAAVRFKDLMRQSDFIARIGGDEFVILLKDIKNITHVTHLAQRIQKKFHEPFVVEENELSVTLSIGVCVVDQDKPLDTDKILTFSDQALYRAKEHGRNRIEFFTQEINDKMQRIVYLENELRHAIEKNELSVMYQPQFNIKNNCELVGCEVLARWNRNGEENVPSDVFIPIAEDSHLINAVSDWVIEQAFSTYQVFSQRFPNILRPNFLSINLSPSLFMHNNIVKQISDKIDAYAIQSNHITIELTETAVMDKLQKMKPIFDALNDVGVCIAIDDFGTGYSSLSYLKELPLKMLKIDKTFIQSLHSDPNCRAIVKSIILLAQAMNLRVIAEGVETKEEVDFLTEYGCFNMQGFYYEKPMSAEALNIFLEGYGKR